jgi:hypothetical protein
MATRNTRTAFTDANGNNRTATHLATNIIIKSGMYVVGAIQTLSITESRDIEMIDEVGTDGHIDSAPKSSTNITGNCTRIRFDKQRIADAFGRSFTHVHAQRIPFDIEIHDTFADADTNNAVVTVLKNVWIKEISYDLSASDWIISDKMSFVAESISSILANNNVVTSVANGQDGPIYLNKFEQEADRGLFRGAMDAAGVLNAFIDDPTS